MVVILNLCCVRGDSSTTNLHFGGEKGGKRKRGMERATEELSKAWRSLKNTDRRMHGVATLEQSWNLITGRTRTVTTTPQSEQIEDTLNCKMKLSSLPSPLWKVITLFILRSTQGIHAAIANEYCETAIPLTPNVPINGSTVGAAYSGTCQYTGTFGLAIYDYPGPKNSQCKNALCVSSFDTMYIL